MKYQIDSTNELAQLVKLAHESPRPATLNRIKRIAKALGVSRERMAFLCRNAVESEFIPRRTAKCPYDETSTKIRVQQYC